MTEAEFVGASLSATSSEAVPDPSTIDTVPLNHSRYLLSLDFGWLQVVYKTNSKSFQVPQEEGHTIPPDTSQQFAPGTPAKNVCGYRRATSFLYSASPQHKRRRRIRLSHAETAPRAALCRFTRTQPRLSMSFITCRRPKRHFKFSIICFSPLPVAFFSEICLPLSAESQ
jgi:hypothetical protein